MIKRQAMSKTNRLRENQRASVASRPAKAHEKQKRIQSCNKTTCTEKIRMVFCLLNYIFINKNYAGKISVFCDLSCSGDNVLYITHLRRALLFLHQNCLAPALLSRSFLLFLSHFRARWDSYPSKIGYLQNGHS